MDAELKKIRKLTEYMVKSGLLHLKVGDIELNLSPSAILPDPPASASNQPDTPEVTAPQYSPEATLYWSSPGNIDEPEELQ